jgi:hypothetical protein
MGGIHQFNKDFSFSKGKGSKGKKGKRSDLAFCLSSGGEMD